MPLTSRRSKPRAAPVRRRRIIRHKRPAADDVAQAPAAAVISPNHKHELILAHAAARHGRPAWGLGYYVAVTASCLVVISGWWLTLGSGLRNNFPGREAAVQTLQENVDRLRQQAQPATDRWQRQSERLRQQFNQAADPQAQDTARRLLQATADRINQPSAAPTSTTR